MNGELLKNVREIHELVQKAGANPMTFKEIARRCGEMTDSDVLILSQHGKALQVYRQEGTEDVLEQYWAQGVMIAQDRAIALGKITEVMLDADLRSYGVGRGDQVRSVLTPLESAGEYLGALILCRQEMPYSQEELVLIEFISMIIARELAQAIYQESAQEKKNSDIVKAAMATLSFSEVAAIVHIFQELDGEEGLLVASKIADRVGITRSVIVNALRKFESAGVIESRSLGMKGTYIRILNSALRKELEKYGKGI